MDDRFKKDGMVIRDQKLKEPVPAMWRDEPFTGSHYDPPFPYRAPSKLDVFWFAHPKLASFIAVVVWSAFCALFGYALARWWMA